MTRYRQLTPRMVAQFYESSLMSALGLRSSPSNDRNGGALPSKCVGPLNVRILQRPPETFHSAFTPLRSSLRENPITGVAAKSGPGAGSPFSET